MACLLDCSIVLLLPLMCFGRNPVNAVFYTAGVVEFSPDELQPSESPQELILRNTRRYVDIIETAAKHGVDILVFPECGLTGIGIPPFREKIFLYLTKMPDVGANPCEDIHAPKVLQMLSCAARKHKLYIVFNLDEVAPCSPDQTDCPSDKSLFYNTNLALDRQGTIVAKYRKVNLFLEPEFNVTKIPDHSWFETDFGVKFGMFICFDILFKEPSHPLLEKNILNYVFPTAWFSESPFLTAISVQAGWAYEHDVNLLASGYSNAPNKNAGSGIYAGRDGQLVATKLDHTSTKLLVARISPDQRGVKPTTTEEIIFSEDTNTALSLFYDDISKYKTSVVRGGTFEYENEGFSCSVTIDIANDDGQEDEQYKIVAFSGVRTYGGVKTVQIEVCGVVASRALSKAGQSIYKSAGNSNSIFTNISISASSEKSFVTFPITTDEHFLSFPTDMFSYRTQKKHGKTEMSMSLTKPLPSGFITFGIYRSSEV